MYVRDGLYLAGWLKQSSTSQSAAASFRRSWLCDAPTTRQHTHPPSQTELLIIRKGLLPMTRLPGFIQKPELCHSLFLLPPLLRTYNLLLLRYQGGGAPQQPPPPPPLPHCSNSPSPTEYPPLPTQPPTARIRPGWGVALMQRSMACISRYHHPHHYHPPIRRYFSFSGPLNALCRTSPVLAGS